ncbi:MAG TPA: Holliday junction resolvase RuvX [bacterium]|nr:Holliday junction resolvase RuvX [bacterium]
MGKILGVDFGEVRTGVAITDPLQIIASPYATLKPNSINDLINKLVDIVLSEDVEKIIVGLPIGTSGQDTDRTKRTRQFIKILQQSVTIPVEQMDERYSSGEAKQLLIEQGIKTGHSKAKVDKVAAAIILRRYLDEQQETNSRQD